jgi:hypothetical protein
MEKKSLAELRKELRELRKEHMKAPSRMRKGDISAEIERMRGNREETAAAASVPSAPMRKSIAAVESIKEAKAAEFPVRPSHEAEPAHKKEHKPAHHKKEHKEEHKPEHHKDALKARLHALLEKMEGM